MAQINQLSAYENPASGDQLPVFSTANGDARRMPFSVFAQWLSTAMSNLTFGGYAKVTPVTVASLPSASVAGAGARAFVTDSNTATFNATVAGGGANIVPVFSDGTNWKVG